MGASARSKPTMEVFLGARQPFDREAEGSAGEMVLKLRILEREAIAHAAIRYICPNSVSQRTRINEIESPDAARSLVFHVQHLRHLSRLRVRIVYIAVAPDAQRRGFGLRLRLEIAERVIADEAVRAGRSCP